MKTDISEQQLDPTKTMAGLHN